MKRLVFMILFVGGMLYAADEVTLVKTDSLLGNPNWIFDDFLDPRQVIYNTPATPGPGLRLGDDTSEILIVAGSKLQISDATEGVSPSVQYYPSFSRKSGQVLRFDTWRASNAALRNKFMGAYTTGGAIENAIQIDAGTFYANSLSVGTYSASTDYSSAVVLRGAGAFYFNKEGGYWKLKWVSETGSTAGMKAVVLSSDVNDAGNTFTLDAVKVPKSTWLPVPVLSDGFTGADGTPITGPSDGTGHPELNGGAGITRSTTAGGILSNRASLTNYNGVYYTTSSNVIFSAELQNTGSGIIFRREAGGTFGAATHGSGSIRVETFTPGATTLANIATTFSAGTKITAWIDGSSYRIYYGSTLISTHTITTLDGTASQHAITSWSAGACAIDNALVWPIGSENQHSSISGL